MNARLLPAVCSVTFRSAKPEEVVRLASQAGLAAIEWGGDIHVPPGDAKRAELVGRMTRDAGLAVSSYGSYLAPPDALPVDVEAAFDAAEALGARHLRIWAGSRERPSADYTIDGRRRTICAITAIAGRAAARGLTVGLEYHPKTLTDTLASARELVAALGLLRNVFLYWQPAPGLPLDAAIGELRAIGQEVCHFHVFAWDERAKRYPLSVQDEYWRRCLAVPPDDRRWTDKSYAMLEFVENDDPTAFLRDAATLRAMLECRPVRDPAS